WLQYAIPLNTGIRPLTLKLRHYLRAVSEEAPDILRFCVAQDVTVAVARQHPEVGLAGRVPAVLDLRDLQDTLPQMQPKGALVRPIARITFDANYLFTHGFAPIYDSPPALRSTRRPGT